MLGQLDRHLLTLPLLAPPRDLEAEAGVGYGSKQFSQDRRLYAGAEKEAKEAEICPW